MKTTKRWKRFFDHEEEEKWLNEMAAKGLAMGGHGIFPYRFEECAPGEYIYRIELLKGSPSKPENVRYIRFMEDNGVEHIESYFSWVYFRKKAADGPFEIYSDLDSKIEHYQRVSRMWFTVATAELLIAVMQVVLTLFGVEDGEPSTMPSLVILLEVMVGALILQLWWRYSRRVKRLKAERTISE